VKRAYYISTLQIQNRTLDLMFHKLSKRQLPRFSRTQTALWRILGNKAVQQVTISHRVSVSHQNSTQLQSPNDNRLRIVTQNAFWMSSATNTTFRSS